VTERKIQGTFCERVVTPKRAFAPRSFRWKRSGKAWVMIGCPLGKWRNGSCSAGTKAHVILVPGGRCGRGERRIDK